MSFGRAEEAKRAANSADVLPSSSPTPRRSDAAILADELAKSAGQINWPRLPELKEFEQVAEMIRFAVYYFSEEPADTWTAERNQLYKILSDGRAGWARHLRKILGSKAPPTEAEVKKTNTRVKISLPSSRKGEPKLPLQNTLKYPTPQTNKKTKKGEEIKLGYKTGTPTRTHKCFLVKYRSVRSWWL